MSRQDIVDLLDISDMDDDECVDLDELEDDEEESTPREKYKGPLIQERKRKNQSQTNL